MTELLLQLLDGALVVLIYAALFGLVVCAFVLGFALLDDDPEPLPSVSPPCPFCGALRLHHPGCSRLDRWDTPTLRETRT